MLDRSGFWPAAIAPDTRLSGDGLSVHLLPTVSQLMVSGDLARFCAAHDLPEPVGLLGLVSPERYALRLARHQMLVVGLSLDHASAGYADGMAVTPMSGALAVVEITGPRAMEIYARATAVDPKAPSPSAALTFAGANAYLCRIETGLRLHLDRGLVSYFFDWAEATGLVS